MTELDEARARINALDAEMARLFEERMNAAATVGAYKKKHGLPIDDPAREEEILTARAGQLKDPALRPYYERFLRGNFALSKEYQRRLLDGMRVAFAGVSGAFADVTAKKIFPHASRMPYPDFKSAYTAVEKGECDCVLLPVENSFNGDVGQVMDLAFFGGLSISGLYEAAITQNLLAVKEAEISDIRRVISHPQALGQCAAYIERHRFEAIAAENTAVAAKETARLGDRTLAAIGSEEAADIFGLKVLDRRINDSAGNTTRFAVFTRTAREPDLRDRRFILLFTVKNAAGSLGKAVSVIGERGFNLRALKSRPTKEPAWEYYFYAEGEGCLASAEGQQMLRELARHCRDLRVIGSFERETVL